MLEGLVAAGGVTLVVLIGLMIIIGACLVIAFFLAVLTHDHRKWEEAHPHDYWWYVVFIYLRNLRHAGEYKRTLIYGTVLLALGIIMARILLRLNG